MVIGLAIVPDDKATVGAPIARQNVDSWFGNVPKKSSQHDSDQSENQSNSPKMMYPYKTWQNILWVEQVKFFYQASNSYLK